MPKTLIVVEHLATDSHNLFKAIDFSQYLQDYPKRDEPKTRIINLCDSGRYLSQGYYCSLLAEARGHQVLPSVRTINSLRDSAHVMLATKDFAKELAEAAKVSDLEGQKRYSTLICFGQDAQNRLKKLASYVFNEYPAPLLKVELCVNGNTIELAVKLACVSELNDQEHTFFQTTVAALAGGAWKKQSGNKQFRWEIAMLVNANEVSAPSNKGALARFVKAGEKLGIRVQQIEAHEAMNLSHFDGLFIRETTGIDHHTYRIAQRAEKLGLVVIDDPQSILRCCNKVFLHDAFNYQKVPSLKTLILADASALTINDIEQNFAYPLVLKMPEGSFSRGVYKVKDQTQLLQTLDKLLAESALVLAQEYMFTDYDWRIGVINGRAFYACRYYMARNHWQIYNHGSKRNVSGGFDCLPTFEVPKAVLTAALKAAAVAGDGLYGIDIKEVDGKAYVLEVNDNPSIDHGVEDKYLGEELYMQVMAEFLRRLEARGRKAKS
jgi:glutathione synthase/RimK-type ligase-like ATP-grasp enzyme